MPTTAWLSTFLSQVSANGSFTVSHSPRRRPAGPRPLLLLQSGLLPLWAGWFRTGRAGWRSSGWWCRPVSSSPPPCSPTWWTAFLTLSVCLSVLLNKTSRNVSPQEKKTPPQKPKVQVYCFIASTSYSLSLCSPTDLLSDLLLLRVPGAPLRTPDVLWMDVCARAKLLTVWGPINVIHDAAFFKYILVNRVKK